LRQFRQPRLNAQERGQARITAQLVQERGQARITAQLVGRF
jgi:hypothetical protein